MLLKSTKKMINSFFWVTIINLFFTANSPLNAIVRLGVKNQFKKDKVMCITVPKSGTHLLLKCLTLIGANEIVHDYQERPIKKVKQINKRLPPYHYKGFYYDVLKKRLPQVIIDNITSKPNQKLLFSHCPYIGRLNYFLQNITSSNFLMIRDPRDVVISLAFMIYKDKNGKTANIDKIILDFITGEKKYFVPWGVEHHEIYPLIWEIGIGRLYEMYLPWMRMKNFMLVKFEDLVGEMGGGSQAKQLETIVKIGNHLKTKMTLQEIQAVTNNLFGGTWTFREGKIGSWKKYFTPEIKKAFKQNPLLIKLLIELGYERDNKW